VKYLVEMDGNEIELIAVGDGVELRGAALDCSLHHGDQQGSAKLTVGKHVYRIHYDASGTTQQPGVAVIWVNGERFPVRVLDERARRMAALAAATTPVRKGGDLLAPMPGMIVKVHVVVGQDVAEGDGLVVIEAMKMENELRARFSGIVKRVHVEQGKAVEKGTLLVEIG
jgi:biotin carboxyl carrier protein